MEEATREKPLNSILSNCLSSIFLWEFLRFCCLGVLIEGEDCRERHTTLCGRLFFFVGIQGINLQSSPIRGPEYYKESMTEPNYEKSNLITIISYELVHIGIYTYGYHWVPIISTLPSSWCGVGTEYQFCRKKIMASFGHGFSEEVRQLMLRWDIEKMECFWHDMFMNKVAVNFDMFGQLMKNKIVGILDSFSVIWKSNVDPKIRTPNSRRRWWR